MIDSVSKDTVCVVQNCIVSKKQGANGAAMKFAQARLSPPTFAQVASEAALDTPQSYFDEVISEYRERRDTLITELHKIEGAKVALPKRAFYCIAELPIENADDFARWLLESYDLDGETVMVALLLDFTLLLSRFKPGSSLMF
jgi:aspartate aminotransferase